MTARVAKTIHKHIKLVLIHNRKKYELTGYLLGISQTGDSQTDFLYTTETVTKFSTKSIFIL